MKYLTSIEDFVPGKIYKSLVYASVGYKSVLYAGIFDKQKPFIFLRRHETLLEYVEVMLCDDREIRILLLGNGLMIKRAKFVEIY